MTFITAEQGRRKVAAVYHMLRSPSPTRHCEINASVTMKSILMWSCKQQISDSRNMKTDCIKNIQLETQILLSRHINKLQLDECRSLPHRPEVWGRHKFQKHWFYSIIDGTGSQKKKSENNIPQPNSNVD